MQKSLLFVGAALMLLGVPDMAGANSRPTSKAREMLAVASRKAAAMSADVVARFYHPETVVAESYNSDDNTWYDPYTTKYTYNQSGQVLTETTDNDYREYSYDENGNLVKYSSYYIVAGEKKLSQVCEYTYDDVVKNLVIREEATWYDGFTGVATGSSINGVEITRNSDGNITKVQEYSEWDGRKNYYDAMVIEYGADKKAVKITSYSDDEVETEISDIVWERTDGQILTYEYDDYNGDMYFSNNRIASATIKEEDYPQPGIFTATYDGDSYHSLLMVGNDRALEIDFKCIEKFAPREDFDDQYSYDCTSYEVEYEYDEDTDSYYIESTSDRIEENRADAFGINLYNRRETTYKYPSPQHKYDDEIEVEVSKAEVTYDETFGYPLSEVHYRNSSYSGGIGELEPTSRYTYSDYVNVDPADVITIEATEDADAEAEYFNLQGVRVNGKPAPGIYICRKGKVVTKVLVR